MFRLEAAMNATALVNIDGDVRKWWRDHRLSNLKAILMVGYDADDGP